MQMMPLLTDNIIVHHFLSKLVEFKQSLDLKCNFGVMHKSMAAYTYIYGKAVELLQHPVEKSKISIFNKNQRAILCMVLSATHVIYQKRDIINIPVWYARVKRWAYEIKGAERKTGDIPAEACNGPGAESKQHKQVRIRREGGGLQDADRAGRLF